MLNDGLPSQICMQCVQHINRAYSFRQLCERSENALRELLGRPIQQTFLELKPLLATDTLIANSIPEIITGVTESYQTPLPLSEPFAIAQNINTLPNSLMNNSDNHITENINNEAANVNVSQENVAENFNKLQSFVMVSENSNDKMQENNSVKVSVNSSNMSTPETEGDVKNIEITTNELLKFEGSQVDDNTSE